MDFRLTEDQLALRKGVRELLARCFGPERQRESVHLEGAGRGPTLDRELWLTLGEAGFFALRLPVERGGAGLGMPEAVLLFEEAGRVLLPGPLVASHLAAGGVPGAAEGRTVVTALRGCLVEWLDEADVVLAAGGRRLDDVTTHPRGARRLRSADPMTPLHRFTAPDRSAADPGPAAPASTPADPAVLGDLEALLLTAAEQLGTAARVGELAVDWAKEREQFGVPIGSFQAVKHLCAGMLTRTEPARTAVYAAAVTGDPADVAAASLLAEDAAVRGARDCLQVHGGMGFTWESEVHLHLKRALLRSRLVVPAAVREEFLAAALLG